MGYEACANADKMEVGKAIAEGNVGAGTGAAVGKYLGVDTMMKSGIGTYCVEVGGVQCGAIVAVNALGDIIDIETGKTIAGILTSDKTALSDTVETMLGEMSSTRNVFSGNTTISCLITNAKLTKTQCNKLASVVHNGYALAIRPVHTSADGDTVFVMATGEVEVSPDALGALATRIMAKAINRAALAAEPAYGLKAARDFVKE
jgi:L-aminopeptidase/D-esterase-like protein